MKPKFDVEQHTDPACREYHTDIEIGKTSTLDFDKTTRQSLHQLQEELGKAIGNMVYALLQMERVRCIYLHPHSVNVFIKDNWGWDPQIKAVIKKAFCRLAFENEVPDQNEVTIEKLSDKKRCYHFKLEISLSYEEFRRPLRESSQKFLDRVGFPGDEIVEQLFEIPGVLIVTPNSYEISIEVARLFDWEEIEPKIKKVFESVLDRAEITFKNL